MPAPISLAFKEYPLDIYLVGGAVRDALLGLRVVDRDYVVVGATPEQLLALGYQQVGKDFPVFLHPQSKDEYALARTERKSGAGYTGFICEFGPNITLEEDLARRDLTINAIAQDDSGQLHDFYGGQADLAARTLRHVSEAFSEDPLRVLRVARFAARFHDLGFTVAPETLTLMKTMANSGELNSLTPERVWKETEKALASNAPQVFFEVLHRCQALEVLFPELAALFNDSESPETEQQNASMGQHSLNALQCSVALNAELPARFAALCHGLDNSAITRLCQRLKVPNDYQDLALLMSRWHLALQQLAEPTPAAILELLQGTDAWRKPERLSQLLMSAEAEFSAHTPDTKYPQRPLLLHWLAELRTITAHPFVAQGLKGQAIGEAIYEARLARLQTALASD